MSRSFPDIKKGDLVVLRSEKIGLIINPSSSVDKSFDNAPVSYISVLTETGVHEVGPWWVKEVIQQVR